MKLQKLVYSGPGHAPEVPVFDGNPPQVKQNRKDAQKRRNKRKLLEPTNLPPTTKMIKTVKGAVVYIVGTVHEHTESVHEVLAIIEQTHPDFVMLELCHERLYAFDDMTNEFSAAKMAADSVPSCRVVLGDRADSVTKARLKFEGWNESSGCLEVTTDFEILTRRLHQSPACKKRHAELIDECDKQHAKQNADIKLHDGRFVNEILKLTKEVAIFYPYQIYPSSNIMFNERNRLMSKVLHELTKIEQPGKAKRTSVPPVIVAVVGLAHRDGIVNILETDSVPEDVQHLLTIPIGPHREALTKEEVQENFQYELENNRLSSLLNTFNLQVQD